MACTRAWEFFPRCSVAVDGWERGGDALRPSQDFFHSTTEAPNSFKVHSRFTLRWVSRRLCGFFFSSSFPTLAAVVETLPAGDYAISIFGGRSETELPSRGAGRGTSAIRSEKKKKNTSSPHSVSVSSPRGSHWACSEGIRHQRCRFEERFIRLVGSWVSVSFRFQVWRNV